MYVMASWTSIHGINIMHVMPSWTSIHGINIMHVMASWTSIHGINIMHVMPASTITMADFGLLRPVPKRAFALERKAHCNGPQYHVSAAILLHSGARCSSVVRAFAHGAMGRRIDPSWG